MFTWFCKVVQPRFGARWRRVHFHSTVSAFCLQTWHAVANDVIKVIVKAFYLFMVHHVHDMFHYSSDWHWVCFWWAWRLFICALMFTALMWLAWNSGFRYVRILLCRFSGLSLPFSPSTFDRPSLLLLRFASSLPAVADFMKSFDSFLQCRRKL